MTTPVETETVYISDFLRGFADGLGVTLGLAREYWETRARVLNLSIGAREKLEAQGYTAGQAEGLRLQRRQQMKN